MSVAARLPSLLSRACLSVVLAASVAVAGVSAARAQDEKPKRERKPKEKPAKPEGAGTGAPGGAQLVATFGDWGAYTANTGKAKICYALSEPKARTPASLKDTKAYLFVSIRPADNVRNELASVLNFKTKDGGPASIGIGSTNYDLVTRGENAWIKAESDEAQAIAAMAKGGNVTVQATSARGNKTSDRYSLTGFTQALDRAKRDCP